MNTMPPEIFWPLAFFAYIIYLWLGTVILPRLFGGPRR